ncbi:MAG: exodeoxyribonuclease VII large subunit [Pseudomonadota bacterium]
MARQAKDRMQDGGSAGEAGGVSNVPEFSVTELSGAIKRALEDGFGYVRLRGEVSGYRGPHASGHCYFSLKDEKAKIDAVVWRGVFSKLKVAPEEGMEVIAQGRVTSYPGSSKYQIVIDSLEPAGVGALMAILEARKKQLGSEGLFDEARKKPIPFLPGVIGIVTSPTGAVIRDMLAGFKERYPAKVVVWPVRVQGETSGEEVSAAVRGFNALPAQGSVVPRPDIIIVARGGGSLEDLWGFNDEAVVRAVADSDLPVISAVGHETDWTLIDLAADARAPTPTKAAEWAVPKYADLLAQNADLTARLRTSSIRRIEAARSSLKAAARGLPRKDNLLALPRQRFDALEQRLPKALVASTRGHAHRVGQAAARLQPGVLRARIGIAGDALRAASSRGREALLRIAGQRRRRLDVLGGRVSVQPILMRTQASRVRLDGVTQRGTLAMARIADNRRRSLTAVSMLLKSLSYQGVLSRGFALVRNGDGVAQRHAAGLEAGMGLSVEFHDGRVGVIVNSDGRLPANPGAATSDVPSSVLQGSANQGSATQGATSPVQPRQVADYEEGTGKDQRRGREPTRNQKTIRKPRTPEQGSLF